MWSSARIAAACGCPITPAATGIAPKCQRLDKERWVAARLEDLLPIAYYHVVFTIPAQLRPLALRNQKVVYGILFRAGGREPQADRAADSKYLGALIGFIAMLHTWSRTMMDHPHLHCLVTGGGLSADGRKWFGSRKGFFVPVRVLSALYRGKFLYYLKQGHGVGGLGIFRGCWPSMKIRGSFAVWFRRSMKSPGTCTASVRSARLNGW